MCIRDRGRKDDVVTFEQLGVDRLFVDEAHNYKNRAKRCASVVADSYDEKHHAIALDISRKYRR